MAVSHAGFMSQALPQEKLMTPYLIALSMPAVFTDRAGFCSIPPEER